MTDFAGELRRAGLVVNRDILEKRILRLERILRKLKDLSAIPFEKYLQDENVQDRAERNLQLAAQICIDIGSHVIAEKGYRPPYSYADIFKVLEEEGCLPEDLANTMQKIAGFRNILVHDYLEVDHKIVYDCLHKIEDFQRLATHALTW